MPRWKTSGSPPEPSNDADLADHEVVIAGAHDVGHLAAQQRERMAHGEVAEAVLHRMVQREVGAALGEFERDVLPAAGAGC